MITDPADPRLKDDLKDFARQVERIVARRRRRARAARSCSTASSPSDGTTTFERSREFDVDRVVRGRAAHDRRHDPRALRAAVGADVRQAAGRAIGEVDGVQLDVPRVSATALRNGLLADAEARERLVRRLGHAGPAPAARRLAGRRRRSRGRSRSGSAATSSAREMQYGKREFVEGPLPVRVERGTLVISGGADDDAIALTSAPAASRSRSAARDVRVRARKVDRVRVDGGDGNDTFAIVGPPAATCGRGRPRPRGDVDVDGVEILPRTGDELTVGDLSATDVFQVDADADRDDRVRLRGRRPDLVSAASACSARRSCSCRPVARPLPDGRRPRRRRHHQRLDSTRSSSRWWAGAATTCCSAARATTT